MKRFLMLMSVAVVAAAMYVAAGSASQQASGPTAKQFKALTKRVTALSKEVKSDGNLLNNLAYAYLHCSLHYGIGVSQRGDINGGGTFGYQYVPQGGTTPANTTALDLDPTAFPEFVITPYNSTDSACQNLIGTVAPRNAGKLLARVAQRH